MMAALAVVAVVLLSTGAVASATPGIDPFKPIATGPTGSSGGGSSSATTPTTTAGSGSSSTGSTSSGSTSTGAGAGSTPSAPASSSSATPGSGSGLAFTGSHTMSIFLLGLITIFVGVPLVRAGRRWFDARHWPAC